MARKIKTTYFHDGEPLYDVTILESAPAEFDATFEPLDAAKVPGSGRLSFGVDDETTRGTPYFNLDDPAWAWAVIRNREYSQFYARMFEQAGVDGFDDLDPIAFVVKTLADAYPPAEEIERL